MPAEQDYDIVPNVHALHLRNFGVKPNFRIWRLLEIPLNQSFPASWDIAAYGTAIA
jgi:hypothetical protein